MAVLHSQPRETMIAEHLRARGIHDVRVLDAMRSVPRERFVNHELASNAYDDRALPIDCSQTISQPYIVALMTQALEVAPAHRILEIGTGSGYQAAVLATLGAVVYTIERHPKLAESAYARLNLLGFPSVHVCIGDGSLGLSAQAPYDRVIITAATPAIPPSVWQQLAEGGIAVVPLGGTDQQSLCRVHKVAGQPRFQLLASCRFVPLLPAIAPTLPPN